MKSLCLLVWLLLIPCLVQAQDQSNVVREIKADLIARGVNLSGPCGAFQITKRVAWRLREQGYGLLGGKSSAQNGCATNGDKYAIDWLLKASGEGVDILSDAGGDNGVIWAEEEAEARLYRPAFDPGDTPTPMPSPPSTSPNLSTIMDLIDRLQRSVDAINTKIGDLRLLLTQEEERRLQSDNGLMRWLTLHKVEDSHKSTCKASIFGIPVSCRLE